MGQARDIDAQFPLAGINRANGFQKQAPYSTRSATNVRGRSTPDRSARGGRRPGINKCFQQQLGSGAPVRCLATVRPLTTPGGRNFSDEFTGTTFGSSWAQLAAYPELKIGSLHSQGSSAPIRCAYGDDPVNTEYKVHTLPSDMDTSGTWDLFQACYLQTYVGSTTGQYQHSLLTRLDNTSPNPLTDGVWFEIQTVQPLVLAGGDQTTFYWVVIETVSGVSTVKATGTVVKPLTAYFEMRVTRTTTTNNFYLNDSLLYTGTFTSSTGKQRIAIGGKAQATGQSAMIDRVLMTYTAASGSSSRADRLAAISNGTLYVENQTGTLIEKGTSPVVHTRSDTQLLAQERLANLYVADYSDAPVANAGDGTTNGSPGTTFDSATYTDWTALGVTSTQLINEYVLEIISGTGVTPGVYAISAVSSGSITLAVSPGISASNIVFAIERSPKVYNSDADTFVNWTATSGRGSVPLRCPLIAQFRDRIVLGGAHDAPHVWYMSRQGNPNDWLYADVATGVAAAIAGTSTTAGIIPSPLTAIIAFSDDYCVFCCRNEMWVLRGDPANGGYMANLSRTIGCIDKKAWCWGPQGELVFLSRDGLYGLTPGAMSFPQRISRDVIPVELVNIDTQNNVVNMEYDVEFGGVHIYITPLTAGNQQQHWWFDWLNKSFWMERYPALVQPFSAVLHDPVAATERKSLIGCGDGYVRQFSDSATDDDGTAIESQVFLGPFVLGDGMFSEGLVTNLQAQVGMQSGDIDWEIRVGDSAEQAFSATAQTSGTWLAGLNARPAMARCRGHAAYIVLGSTAQQVPWVLERLAARLKQAGTLRVA